MLRTAAAATAQAAFLPSGTVDAFSPKVRAAMGAQFRLPLRSLPWEGIAERLPEDGLRVYLADAGQGTVICSQANFRRPMVLIVGGEAGGAGSSPGPGRAGSDPHARRDRNQPRPRRRSCSSKVV